MSASYRVNEVFYSVQGEGVLAGTAMVFVRFAGCNLSCALEPGPRSPGGFDCDTEFTSGRSLTAVDLEVEVWAALGEVVRPDAGGRWMLLTGGEPGLQVDLELCAYFRSRGWRLAIETNGSVALPRASEGEDQDLSVREALESYPFDHITVSPKVAEHAVRQRVAHELRYVRGHGQPLPRPSCRALAYLVSPASFGDQLDQRAATWCVGLVLEDSHWRLSLQYHKALRVR